jgi:hypothetical protein
MPETYKPEVNIRDGRPVLNTNQEGVATTAKLDVEKVLDITKDVFAGLVAVAAVGATQLPPHTVAFSVCMAIVGFGAALGIRSRGVQRKRKK